MPTWLLILGGFVLAIIYFAIQNYLKKKKYIIASSTWYTKDEARKLYDASMENFKLVREYLEDKGLEECVLTCVNGVDIEFNQYFKPLYQANIYKFAEMFLFHLGFCTVVDSDNKSEYDVKLISDVAEAFFRKPASYNSIGDPKLNPVLKWLIFAENNKLIRTNYHPNYGPLTRNAASYIVSILAKELYDKHMLLFEKNAFLLDVEFYKKPRRGGMRELVEEIEERLVHEG